MKQNYLMGIIREEISNYLGENEQMYDSPQTQQREMNKLLDQVEQLKQLRDNLDAQIAQLEATANTFNVNEDAAANKAAADAQRMAIDKKITALNKTKQELSKPGTSLNEDNEISISGSDWEDMGLGRVITKFNDGVKISWNEDDPNLYHARVYGLNGKDENIYIDFLRKVNAEKQGLDESNQLDEETLNEMPFIGGEKGTELFNAIKSASEKLKDKFPDATAKDISKIILSKKKRPEFAPEVEDALMAQEEKYGDDPKYTSNLGGPQTEKAVAKALGEYEPGQRGRKSTEKPAVEPKSTKPKSTPSSKTEKPKAEKPTTAKTEPVDKEDAAAMKMAASVKGGAINAGDKYGKLKKALDAKTAELKAMVGSPDMEKRKALTAEKMRIEAAIEKLKQVKM